MKNCVKLFVASLIVLACAVGFFLGTCCSVHCCPKHSCDRMDAPEKVAAAPHDGHFKKGHEGMGFQKSWPHPAMFDSLLQVTPEQKTALDKHREETGKAFKELYGQKMSAEKELKEALDSGDEAQIEAICNCLDLLIQLFKSDKKLGQNIAFALNLLYNNKDLLFIIRFGE